MAYAWFLHNENTSSSGPTDPISYSLVRVQPDCIAGSEICAIYAEIQFIQGKVRPHISRELELEINMAKLIGKPSTNVLLKQV
jgi:hypothetical protein